MLKVPFVEMYVNAIFLKLSVLRSEFNSCERMALGKIDILLFNFFFLIVINVKVTQSSTHNTLMKNLRVQKHGVKLTQTSVHTQ